MLKQRGSALITLVVIGLIIGAIAMTLLSYANKAVEYEQNINKFDKASQNTLSNYTLKITEMFAVPAAYVEDLKSVVKETFQGRYGADGSQATMQWIKEQNLQFDASLYKELQVTIASGRDEFKMSQDRKLEICTQYDILTNRPVSKFILGVIGYPSIEVKDKCRIVLDQGTIDTFKSGIAKPITPRG